LRASCTRMQVRPACDCAVGEVAAPLLGVRDDRISRKPLVDSTATVVSAFLFGDDPTMTDDVVDAWERILGRLRTAVAAEFEILREIGSGGMAAVYLAREIALNRQVAIKVMSPALLTGKGMIERFKQEARTIAALDHRNIITIYAVRGSEDLHFFVMKFVKGRSLEHIIRTAGPLPIPMVRGLLHMIGDALGHAHRRGVIHRDVKPANILVDGDGNAIVTDFGIAKVVQGQGEAHSAVIIGTPAYMSPEQCYAQPASAASDQYSLGVLAYEMLTGRPPFSGSAFVVMEAHTKSPPPPIRDLRRDCPPALEAAVMRMLAKDPGERWPSLHHALAELGAATMLDGHPVRVALAKLGIPEPDERRERDSAPKPYVASLSILAPPDWIESGDSLILRASARNWSGDTMPGIAIHWSSDSPDIAGVDEATGAVVARLPGIVSITASFEEVRSSVTLQVVPRRVAALSVSIPPGSIHVGDRVQLVTRIEDKHHGELKRPVAWQMSDAKIATISDAGVLRAIAPGLGLAFAEAEGIRGSVEIRVAPARVVQVRPSMAPGSLVVGDRFSLGATAMDSMGNSLDGRSLTWMSNDPGVATITSDGLVTARAPGEVEFLCRCEGKSATVALRVESLVTVTGDAPVEEPVAARDTIVDASAAVASAESAIGPDVATQPRVRRPRRRLGRRDLAIGGGSVLVLALAIALSRGQPATRPITDSTKLAGGTVIKDSAATPRGDSSVSHRDSLDPKTLNAGTSAGGESAVVGPAAFVEITDWPIPLRVGERSTLKAVVSDSMENTLPDSVRWSSSDLSVATVQASTGVIHARTPGVVTIYATSGRHEGHVTIHVTAAKGSSTGRPL